jgi:hypothetical protein
MQLSAVILARTLAFLDVNELNPRGSVFFPKIVAAIVERYGFQTFPNKPEEFDESKGVTFADGYFDGQAIENLTLYNDGIKLDVRSSTTQGSDILKGILEWLASDYGVSYGPKTISRWNFVSNVAFDWDLDIDFIGTALSALAERVTKELKHDGRVTDGFHVESINIDLDRTFGEKQIAPFTIQRRKKIAFSEGKYFSAAPLPTDVHISVLEEFEANFRNQKKI